MMDNNDLFDSHELEQEKQLANRPKCDCCGEPIQEDYAFRIEGMLYCEDCIQEMKEFIEN